MSQSLDGPNLGIPNQICKAFLESHYFIEDCLLSDDITDLEPLTPNHLLIGFASSDLNPGNIAMK